MLCKTFAWHSDPVCLWMSYVECECRARHLAQHSGRIYLKFECWMLCTTFRSCLSLNVECWMPCTTFSTTFGSHMLKSRMLIVVYDVCTTFRSCLSLYVEYWMSCMTFCTIFWSHMLEIRMLNVVHDIRTAFRSCLSMNVECLMSCSIFWTTFGSHMRKIRMLNVVHGICTIFSSCLYLNVERWMSCSTFCTTLTLWAMSNGEFRMLCQLLTPYNEHIILKLYKDTIDAQFSNEVDVNFDKYNYCFVWKSLFMTKKLVHNWVHQFKYKWAAAALTDRGSVCETAMHPGELVTK